VNYHDTLPTTPGDYKACSHYDSILSLSQSGKWWDHADERLQDREVEQQLPLIGPLPATQEQAIGLACEVAFARMVVADYQWCAGNRAGPDTERGVDDVLERLASCETRFVRQGERSLSLLRDMERVTGELTKK